ARLRDLQSLLSQLTETLGYSTNADVDGELNVGGNSANACLDCALELSREVLGNETNPPPPLGPALTAVKRRLAQVRLEGATGLRSRLRAELSRAAEVGDIVALRAALAE
ncbi:unnamed protein product, partial [Polarella glacialis]